MADQRRPCKDCFPTSEDRRSLALMGGVYRDGKMVRQRPAPFPGPRCATHHREVTEARKAAAHERYVESTYGLAGGQYAALYEAQGGVCAICQRATGKTRRLSVDHDHACCDGPTSCGGCVRGLLCRPCNDMLGHCRDGVAMLQRAIDYLNSEYVAW